jgi:hypothetical protein
MVGKGLIDFPAFFWARRIMEALQIQPKLSTRARENEQAAERCHP